jgi:2'-5' RNA ligase
LTERRTALSVVVPEAEPVVGDFRRRFDPGAAKNVPPHVSLLFPFAPVASVDDALLDAVRRLYAGAAAFDFALTRVGRFARHVWLAPEPKERFVELIRLSCARFPEYPRYGGEFDGREPVPHLTVGEADDVEALAQAAERELGPHLPVRGSIGSVTLLEEQPDLTWAARAEFPL